jgi:aminoglycoside 2'-N-acetyltransferase I
MRRLPGARLRKLSTPDLTPSEVDIIRSVLVAAFGSDEEERFTDDDWDHALGGVHFVLDVGGEIVTHASVVERELHIDRHPVRAGYVEAVGTAAGREGAGFGSLVIAAVSAYIRDGFELGALGTGRHHFYERLGWERWKGPSFARTAAGERPTRDDDGYILVLRTPTSPPLDLTAPIVCEERQGDDW